MDRLCISFDNDEEKHSEIEDTSIINSQIACHRANFIKLQKKKKNIYIYIRLLSLGIKQSKNSNSN